MKPSKVAKNRIIQIGEEITQPTSKHGDYNSHDKTCSSCDSYPCDVGMRKYDREYNALLDASVHPDGCPDWREDDKK